jgi:hypothetical protein
MTKNGSYFQVEEREGKRNEENPKSNGSEFKD